MWIRYSYHIPCTSRDDNNKLDLIALETPYPTSGRHSSAAEPAVRAAPAGSHPPPPHSSLDIIAHEAPRSDQPLDADEVVVSTLPPSVAWVMSIRPMRREPYIPPHQINPEGWTLRLKSKAKVLGAMLRQSNPCQGV